MSISKLAITMIFAVAAAACGSDSGSKSGELDIDAGVDPVPPIVEPTCLVDKNLGAPTLQGQKGPTEIPTQQGNIPATFVGALLNQDPTPDVLQITFAHIGSWETGVITEGTHSFSQDTPVIAGVFADANLQTGEAVAVYSASQTSGTYTVTSVEPVLSVTLNNVLFQETDAQGAAIENGCEFTLNGITVNGTAAQ